MLRKSLRNFLKIMNRIFCKINSFYESIYISLICRYPGTTFIDHIRRYQANPNVSIIVLLGEVGGIDEYIICEALENKEITKPLIAWCMGTCAKMFPYEVQFGHAGALARGKLVRRYPCK